MVGHYELHFPRGCVEDADGACINALQFVTTKDVVHVSSSGLLLQRDLRTAPGREKPKALCL